MQAKQSVKEENAVEAKAEVERKTAEAEAVEDSDDEFKDAEDEFHDAEDEEFKDADQKLDDMPKEDTASLSLREKERAERNAEVLVKASQWEVSKYDDDHKDENAGYYGGFQLTDPEVTDKLRSAAKELLKLVGQKLLSGDFNLTRVSFPIKCMCPLTILQTMSWGHSTMPIYLNYAASIKDNPVERLKLVMAQNISQTYHDKIFHKPLNPILGETYQCFG